MSSGGLTPEALLASIRAAQARKEAALAQYQKAVGEIAWLRQGLELMGITEEVPIAGLDVQSIDSLFPAPEAMPTLRQAIATMVRAQPTVPWKVGDLTLAIVKRGWLPDNDVAAKRVSDMAGVMATDGLLVRLDRGTYAPSPELIARIDLLQRDLQDLPGEEPEPQE